MKNSLLLSLDFPIFKHCKHLKDEHIKCYKIFIEYLFLFSGTQIAEKPGGNGGKSFISYRCNSKC